MADMRDRLIELLAKYFTIGDSYVYNLTRVKEAFAVGTVTIDDFVEFDDEVVADIADHLLADKDISRAFELLKAEKEGKLILPPCKVGDVVYAVTLNTETLTYGVHRGYIGSIDIRQSRIYMFINHEGYDDEPYFKSICGRFDDFGKTVFLTREEAEKALRDKENG